MRVRVILYANLGRYHPRGEGHREFSLDVPLAAPVEVVLGLLGIPLEEHRLVFVNDRRREQEEPLEEGDRVAVFPPVAGG